VMAPSRTPLTRESIGANADLPDAGRRLKTPNAGTVDRASFPNWRRE